MYKIEFLRILGTFSRKRLNKFGEYLNSPYFNKTGALIRLFDIVKKHHPDYSNITEEYLRYSLSNGGKVYSKLFMKKLFSRMGKNLLEFVYTENLKINKYYISESVLNELKENNLKNEYLKTFNQAILNLSKLGLCSNNYLYQYMILTNKFNFDYERSRILKKKNYIRFIDELDRMANKLFDFFIIDFTSLYFSSYFVSYNANFDFKQTDIYKIYNSMNFNSLSEINIQQGDYHKTYGYLLKLYGNYDNEEYYTNYKDMVFKYSDQMQKDEFAFHVHKLISYCILKIENNSSVNKYSSEIISLYDVFLNHRLFVRENNKYLSREIFRSIVLNTSRYGKTEWLIEFLNKAGDYLNPSEVENLSHYGYMYAYFYSNNFEKALHHANKIKLDYFIYKFDVKDLLLRIFYELGYTEETLNQIRSFLQFVRTEKISGAEWKRRYINFALYLEKIVKYRAGDRKRIDIGFLENKLMKSDNVYYREWLIEKIQPLKKLKAY
jgi:hypothetical protein